LLLLHGGLGDAELHWKEAIPPLGETYHVFAPDLPGFGGTAPLPDMSMSTLLDWLRALLDALNLEQAVIIGNSVGALPARLLAAAHPHYTPALILVNGGAIPNPPPILMFLLRIRVVDRLLLALFGRMWTSRRSLERMIFVKDVLTDEFVQRVQANARNGALLMRAMLVHPIPEERVPRIPTLLLWGANDEMTPLVDAEALKKDIPGAKLSEVADCGGMPQLEATDVFVYQVNYFLQRITRPPETGLPGVGMLKSK
jgi:pimeloyl-ACP methyl ester carboxylesterase